MRDSEIACDSCGLTMGESRKLAALRAPADARPVGEWVKHHRWNVPHLKWAKGYEAKIGDKLYTHPEASAPGLSDAIAWVTKRRDDYIEEFGHVDPDTGALEYGTGKHAEAKREYVGELDEIIEGLQSLTRASAATVAEPSERTADEIVAEQQRTHEFVQFADRTRYVANIDPKKGIKPYPEAAQQQAEPQRNWTEDATHENGNYECRCHSCGSMFVGHKGRLTCKLCANTSQQAEPGADERAALDEAQLDALHEAIARAKDEGLPGTAEHLQAIFDAHNPEASAPGLSEREIADTVNKVRDIALQFHATQQLRGRIARVLVPILTRASAATAKE